MGIRVQGMLLPLLLIVAGVGLIIAAQLELDGAATPAPSPTPAVTPPPDRPSPSPRPSPTPTASPEPGAIQPATPTATPSPSPLPDGIVAERLEIPAVGIDVPMRFSPDAANDAFPGYCCAFILSASSEPGRNTNSYVFAHAVPELFLPLWGIGLGDGIRVTMSDGTPLDYRVTEIRPNVPCPDPNPPNPGLNPEALGVTLPLNLQYADSCDEAQFWLEESPEERLTLQTSQGYNRNWGEFIVIARPVRD